MPHVAYEEILWVAWILGGSCEQLTVALIH